MAFIPLDGLKQSSTRTGIKKSLRSETEKGYIYSRSQMLPKQKFSLDFLLTTAQSNTLEAFFYANTGSNFNLVYDGVTYTVIFISNEIIKKNKMKNLKLRLNKY
jgi:hypothetical protein